MGAAPLFTFSDAMQAMRDFTRDNVKANADRQIRRAILSAYREIANSHRWTYLYAQGRVTTVAPYSTGTVAFDHCVTPDHEALTMSGWKKYNELAVGEHILAYDHDRGISEWQPIEKLHVYEYTGDMLEVERDGAIVFKCTPNHRIPVLGRGRRGHKVTRKFVEAKNLTKEHATPLCAPLIKEQEELVDSKIASLIGWVITDGHGWKNNKSEQVAISQSTVVNPEKCDEIESLVGRPASISSEGKATFQLQPEDKHVIRYILRKQGLVPTFARFAVQEAEAAFRAMILAEASTSPINGQKVFCQWGSNHQVAEAFQIACLLSGRATNIRKTQQKTYKGYADRYQCSVRKSETIKLAKNSKWVPYSGTVWCPQVRSGAWIVRCNGCVMTTGNSGGSIERKLTLSGGVWPAWTLYGTVVIGAVSYEVASRVSDTVLQLAIGSNPGADLAADTEYTLYRDTYTLPHDFVMSDEMILEHYWTGMEYVHPSQWLASHRFHTISSSIPYIFTIRGDPNTFGCLAVSLYPTTATAQTIDFVYERRPRGLATDEVKAGTVTVAADSTAVVGSGTNFTPDMAGAVLRISDDGQDWPTGVEGANPATAERVVMSVENTTNLTVDAAFTGTLTGIKYVISDPLDLEYGAMLTCFNRCCEKELAIALNMAVKADAIALYRAELIRARETDSRSTSQRSASSGRMSPIPSSLWHANNF